MVAVIEGEKTQLYRQAVSQDVQTTVDGRVKEILLTCGPQLDKIAKNAAQAFAGIASKAAVSLGTQITFSAAEKSDLVNGAVDAVVEQLGADLTPNHKSALKSNLSDTIKYALKAELQSVNRSAAEKRRRSDSELEPPGNGHRIAVRKGDALSDAGGLVFAGQNRLGSSGSMQATPSRQDFGFGTTGTVGNSQQMNEGMRNAVPNSIVATGSSTQNRYSKPLSVREIRDAITGASTHLSNEINYVRSALSSLHQEPSALQGARSPILDDMLSGAQQFLPTPPGQWLQGRITAGNGSFHNFLRQCAGPS